MGTSKEAFANFLQHGCHFIEVGGQVIEIGWIVTVSRHDMVDALGVVWNSGRDALTLMRTDLFAASPEHESGALMAHVVEDVATIESGRLVTRGSRKLINRRDECVLDRQ